MPALEVAGRGAKAEHVSSPQVEHCNEVRLIGSLGAEPEERTLPSGDTVWSFRLNVERLAADVRSRQRVDSVDCAVWRGRVKRSVPGWKVGDVVDVSGAIRKRFFRGAAGSTASRVEIEVVRGKVIRRAASG